MRYKQRKLIGLNLDNEDSINREFYVFLKISFLLFLILINFINHSN